MCFSMEDPDHIPGRLNVVAVQVGPDHLHRMVSPSRGLSLICHKVQQKVSSGCNTSTGPLTWAVDALILLWEDLDAYAFPPVAMLAKVVAKLQGLPMQENH